MLLSLTQLKQSLFIYFFTAKAAKSASVRLLNQEVIAPKELIKQLGIWFDPSLSFKQHVTIRTSQARSVLQRITKLASSKEGYHYLPYVSYIQLVLLAQLTMVVLYGEKAKLSSKDRYRLFRIQDYVRYQAFLKQLLLYQWK